MDVTEQREKEILSILDMRFRRWTLDIANLTLQAFIGDIDRAQVWLKGKPDMSQTALLSEVDPILRELHFYANNGDYPAAELDRLAALTKTYGQKMVDDANINLDKKSDRGRRIVVDEAFRIKNIFESEFAKWYPLDKPQGYAELIKRLRSEVEINC
jgi:hypothetical protein